MPGRTRERRIVVVALFFYAAVLSWTMSKVVVHLRAQDRIQDRIPIRVIAVHDGDTITFAPRNGDNAGPFASGPLHGRLLLVDAPELAQHPWGYAARFWLEAALAGRDDIAVELDPTEPRDKYGRIPIYLMAGDACLNERGVAEGWFYAYNPSGKALARSAAIQAAERTAHRARRGVWRPDPPLTRPEDYRRTHATKVIKKKAA
jgi:micrococcal nuclease